MTDLWSDVRADVLRRLEAHSKNLLVEERMLIAEDAAHQVKAAVERFCLCDWNEQSGAVSRGACKIHAETAEFVPCTRGSCAAEDGHDGTCAQASGWSS